MNRRPRRPLGTVSRPDDKLGLSPSSDPAVEVHGFVVTVWSRPVNNLAPDEHDDLRWFSAHELTSLTLTDPAILPVVLRVLRSSRD
jgi:8-oxo-dGTP diphosphatase